MTDTQAARFHIQYSFNIKERKNDISCNKRMYIYGGEYVNLVSIVRWPMTNYKDRIKKHLSEKIKKMGARKI